MNVARLLWESAQAVPERIAIRDGDRALDYAALAGRAAAIRDALVESGLRSGDRVGILLPHGADGAAAFYGGAAAGAIATVINWLYRPRQVETVLEHAGVSVLVTTREWASLQVRALEGKTRLIFVEDLAAVGRGTPIDAAGETPAQITYTSGSSGGPKGVVMSHDNLLAGIHTVVQYLGITREDHIASVLPFSFVYGFNQLNCAVATGARLDVMNATMGAELLKSLDACATTVLAGVPPIWMQLLRSPAFAIPLPALRIMTCAGGRLSPEAVRSLRTAQPNAKLYLMYGLTEVFRSTYLPPEEVDAHPDSMGRAVPGSRVHVLRDDGTLADDGEVGELVHSGPTVALGYWNDAETTAKVFRANPAGETGDAYAARAVYSGDLVKRDGEGRLYYVGRRDRMIKTLGFRVSPDEIADVLYASKQVTEAVVTAEPDEARGDRIVAHVVLSTGGTIEQLRRWCGVELPRHMQPARWDVRETLPRNPAGKFDLVALGGATK